MVELASEDVVYVSNFLAEEERLKNKNIVILHNAIENDFLENVLSQQN